MLVGYLRSGPESMNITEYLRSMPDAELIENYDWFNYEEDGWQGLACVSITPHGALSKKMVEREIDRRAR